MCGDVISFVLLVVVCCCVLMIVGCRGLFVVVRCLLYVVRGLVCCMYSSLFRVLVCRLFVFVYCGSLCLVVR